MRRTAIVMMQILQIGTQRTTRTDLELPLNIAADRIIEAIAEAYRLGTPAQYLMCEDPIVLIKGKKTLGEFGVHDGSMIKYIY